MVVDDAADARFLICLILREHADLEVVAEADGAPAALERIGAARPDVVLLDARMPVMDGFELALELIGSDPDLRVAMLTSMVDEVVEARAREVGAHACLSKGDMMELPDVVRSLAASARRSA